MREPEIQPLIPLVLRRLQIRLLLILAHASPNIIPSLVHPDVVQLRANKDGKIPRADCDEDFITPTVQRLVIVAVDVLADNRTGLYAHVV